MVVHKKGNNFFLLSFTSSLQKFFVTCSESLVKFLFMIIAESTPPNTSSQRIPSRVTITRFSVFLCEKVVSEKTSSKKDKQIFFIELILFLRALLLKYYQTFVASHTCTVSNNSKLKIQIQNIFTLQFPISSCSLKNKMYK